MNLFFNLLRNLSTALAVVAGFATFILAFLIGIDVLARKFFGISLQGTDEIGGYVLAAVASLGFSHVLFERGFTRIDLFVKRFNVRLLNILNVTAYVSLAAVAVFFAQRGVATYSDTLLFNAHANTPLQTPMWIPQGFWVAGMVFFAFCAVLYAARALLLLFIDRSALEAEYGFTEFDDEIAEISELSSNATQPTDDGKRQ